MPSGVFEWPHSAVIGQPRASSAWLAKLTQSVPSNRPNAAVFASSQYRRT